MASTGRIPLWLIATVGGTAALTVVGLFIFGSYSGVGSSLEDIKVVPCKLMHGTTLIFYATSSCSIYMKAKAITKPGNIMPMIGTRIEGR